MIDVEIFKDYNDIIIDTGIYIEYFKQGETELKKILREHLFSENSEITIKGHYLIKAEIFYIMCRKIGKDKAENIIKDIEEYINFISGEFLYQIAGKIKCKYPIAICDCFSISLGISQDCPIFFLKERELSEEVINKVNKEFKAKIYTVS
ncbi:MAG: hypothetical protein HWN81_13160 [Candidatus Lokiarchaeota archaeon]|nr:hypothetical protein [Candidatus Lokiarchaeota archaeon]